MRGAFGLVSILVCGLIVAWLWASHTAPVAKANKQARQDASKIAGRNENGTPAADSLKMSPVERDGGQLRGARVTAIAPGAVADHFGLAVNDVVLKVGEIDVGTSILDDVDSVRNFIGADALRSDWNLIVDRGGQRITLPAQRNTSATPAAGTASGNQAGNTTGGTPAATATGTDSSTTTPPADTAAPSNPKPAPPRNARGAAEDLVNQLQKRGE